jgi:hypothetical protein
MAKRSRRRPASEADAERGARLQRQLRLWMFPAFALVALLVYRPAFNGPFVSDDVPYISANPYVKGISADNLVAILDPVGPTIPLTANYSPVHLLLHALEWEVFGPRVQGYHVVNALAHALGATLLGLLLLRAGVAAGPAAAGAAFFLLHPANVEAVAWISQLKTTSAFVLALAALLLHPRRPGLATLCFVLAILAKPLAAFALPVAALMDWTAGRSRWLWLGAWVAAFAALAGFEAVAFRDYSLGSGPLHEDPTVWVRTVFALAARYLVMAATSYGVSAFHELQLARSWLDPWWLAGLAASVLLGWRTLWALRRRREEAAWWLWAAVSFAPVSQLFPFDFAMADRYLYLILPGLIGGVLLAAPGLLPLQTLTPAQRPAARALAVGLAVVVGLGFAVRSSQRAALWRSAGVLMADSIAHYPQGRLAYLAAARRARDAGDATGLARALRAAVDGGFDLLPQLLSDFGGARGDPAVDAVFRDLAATWIERLADDPRPNQTELNVLALAYEVRGDVDSALAALERGYALGGPDAPLFQARITELRARRRQPGGP